MTTNNHTPITGGADATAANVNAPLGELDAAIGNLSSVHGSPASVVAAIGTADPGTTAHAIMGAIAEVHADTDTVSEGLAALTDVVEDIDAKVDSLVLAGGNITTLANGDQSAGATHLHVDSETGFIVGARVCYVIADGTVEYNTIDSTSPGVLTLDAVLGQNVSDHALVAMISESEFQAANAIKHTGTITLPTAMEVVGRGAYSVVAYGADDLGVSSACSAIGAATAAAVAAGGGIVVIPAGTFKVDDNVTFDDAVTVLFEGGVLNVSPGKTVTINGYIVAGRYKIFQGSGTVVLSRTSPIFPEWWGAVGDGATDDGAAIQKALDCASTAGGGVVEMAGAHYDYTGVLYVDSYVTLRGQGRYATRLHKTDNGVGTGSNTYAGVSDDYAIDAGIIIRHPDGIKTLGACLESFYLDTASEYGVYAPRLGYSHFNDLYIEAGDGSSGICFYGHTNILCSWRDIRFVINENAGTRYGYGIKLDSSIGTQAATSASLVDCYSDYARYGFYFDSQEYSSLKSCACDHCGLYDGATNYDGTAYRFVACHGISMEGCGAEDVYGAYIRADSASHVSVSGFCGYGPSNTLDTTRGVVEAGRLGSNAEIVVVGSRFSSAAHNHYNTYVAGTSRVLYLGGTRPSGAALGDYVSSGSSLDVWDDGVLAPTEVDIDGGAIDNTPVGSSTPSTGRFTTVRQYATTRREFWQLLGYKESPVDNTFFDILSFAAVGGAASAAERGVCSGLLTITFHNRHTEGYVLARSQLYFVTVYCMYYSGAYVMQSDIQQIGSDNAYEGGGITMTITVQEKSGASATALTIEAKFTHASFGTAGNVMWTFMPHSVGNTAAVHITPAVA